MPRRPDRRVLSRAACGLWLSLAAWAAVASAAPAVRLDRLTWTELRDRIAAGSTTALLPIGGTEQNGPALALGKHNARAEAIAERIAAALGDAIVAPVVAYVPEGRIDPPSEHMRFPGTLSIPVEAFEATLEGASRSLCRAGFRDVFLLADHGGYRASLGRVAARLGARERGPCRVHALDAYYDAAQSPYAALLRGRGMSDAEIGSHAGLADTALTLAVDRTLVRESRLGAAADGGAAVGVHGDPRRASVALGELGVDRIVADSVAAIRRLTATARPKP